MIDMIKILLLLIAFFCDSSIYAAEGSVAASALRPRDAAARLCLFGAAVDDAPLAEGAFSPVSEAASPIRSADEKSPTTPGSFHVWLYRLITKTSFLTDRNPEKYAHTVVRSNVYKKLKNALAPGCTIADVSAYLDRDEASDAASEIDSKREQLCFLLRSGDSHFLLLRLNEALERFLAYENHRDVYPELLSALVQDCLLHEAYGQPFVKKCTDNILYLLSRAEDVNPFLATYLDPADASCKAREMVIISSRQTLLAAAKKAEKGVDFDLNDDFSHIVFSAEIFMLVLSKHYRTEGFTSELVRHVTEYLATTFFHGDQALFVESIRRDASRLYRCYQENLKKMNAEHPGLLDEFIEPPLGRAE